MSYQIIFYPSKRLRGQKKNIDIKLIKLHFVENTAFVQPIYNI